MRDYYTRCGDSLHYLSSVWWYMVITLCVWVSGVYIDSLSFTCWQIMVYMVM